MVILNYCCEYFTTVQYLEGKSKDNINEFKCNVVFYFQKSGHIKSLLATLLEKIAYT